MNAIGQRTALAQTGTAFTGPKTIAWNYDSLGQVSLADVNGMGDRAYEYDAIGNRKKSAHNTLTLPATDNHTSNALNQYTTVPNQTGAISYDLDGNLTQGSTAATSNLVWDGENRLISATNSSSGQTTTYRYDAFSRRISRSVGVSPTTLFIYDAWNCITEYQFHNSSFSLHTSYLWGMDLSGTMQGAGGVGGLLSQRTTYQSPAVIHYPCYDANGNVTQYLTSTGAIATSFEYDPFGRLMINNFTNTYLPYRFSTKPLDQPTGFYYYGYRYYDPTTGRWPSRDPIEEKGGMNLYGFVGNDGVGKWDLLGLRGPPTPQRPVTRPPTLPFYNPPRPGGGYGATFFAPDGRVGTTPYVPPYFPPSTIWPPQPPPSTVPTRPTRPRTDPKPSPPPYKPPSPPPPSAPPSPNSDGDNDSCVKTGEKDNPYLPSCGKTCTYQCTKSGYCTTVVEMDEECPLFPNASSLECMD